MNSVFHHVTCDIIITNDTVNGILVIIEFKSIGLSKSFYICISFCKTHLNVLVSEVFVSPRSFIQNHANFRCAALKIRLYIHTSKLKKLVWRRKGCIKFTSVMWCSAVIWLSWHHKGIPSDHMLCFFSETGKIYNSLCVPEVTLDTDGSEIKAKQDTIILTQCAHFLLCALFKLCSYRVILDLSTGLNCCPINCTWSEFSILTIYAIFTSRFRCNGVSNIYRNLVSIIKVDLCLNIIETSH